MIQIQIKDLRAIAMDVAVDDEENLIFARLILRSPEEVRGVRHAIQDRKLIHSDIGFLMSHRQTQVWSVPRTFKGITSWVVTTYLPELDERLHFIRSHEDNPQTAARQLEAFLHQHTPYPVPPIRDFHPLLQRGEELIVHSESPTVSAYAFTTDKIIAFLEEQIS